MSHPEEPGTVPTSNQNKHNVKALPLFPNAWLENLMSHKKKKKKKKEGKPRDESW
jgi:hypothetical protein